MQNFAFMLKTYEKDLQYAWRLADSFEKYNADDIPLYMVLDGEDKEKFLEFSNLGNVHIVLKEDIDVEYAKEAVNGISSGYINQEIVKLAFWKLNLCKNYLCIDSELEFIREFHIDEFMYDEETPYSVLIEDHDLLANPNYYNAFWTEREKSLERIKEVYGIKDRHILTCHGMQTFSAKVLKSMEEDFMRPNGYSYLDLLKVSPYEFSWYNYYLQKTRPIEIHPCEPHFKTYHMPYQQIVDAMQGIDLESLKRAYCGIILNSNYSRGNTRDVSDVSNLDWVISDKKTLQLISKIIKKSRLRFLAGGIKNKIVGFVSAIRRSEKNEKQVEPTL